MLKVILMDIEGTTTSISFVHEVLFPYAKKHLRSFVLASQASETIQQILESVKATVLKENQKAISFEEAIFELEKWIDEDRKHPALKELQGLLWKKGYEAGDYQGHLYEDVLPMWKTWKTKNLTLAIYSSGSVAAQQQIFGFNQMGDLRPYLSAYFDTKVGGKKEVTSYKTITESLKVNANEILFLSDMPGELEAAQAAGLMVCQVVRPGTQGDSRFTQASQFNDIVT